MWPCQQGALSGGFISDKLLSYRTKDGTKLGARARILVIIASNMLAAPFCLGALTLPAPQSFSEAPWAFLCLIPANVIGEMWIGVTLTVVIESVPAHLKTTSVALYLFIITNIGGNAPLLVRPMFFFLFPVVRALTLSTCRFLSSKELVWTCSKHCSSCTLECMPWPQCSSWWSLYSWVVTWPELANLSKTLLCSLSLPTSPMKSKGREHSPYP